MYYVYYQDASCRRTIYIINKSWPLGMLSVQTRFPPPMWCTQKERSWKCCRDVCEEEEGEVYTYIFIERSHRSVPVAIKTSGVHIFGPNARQYFMDVVRCIHRVNLEEKAIVHLFPCLSVAVYTAIQCSCGYGDFVGG